MTLFRDSERQRETGSPATYGEERLLGIPPPLQQARRLALIAESVLFASILICTLVLHSDKVNTYGISYFGVRLVTLPIIATGFVLGGALLVSCSNRLPNFTQPWKLIKITLRCVGVGIVLLLLTPYTVDTFFNWTHMTIGAAIFATQMYAGAVIVFKYQKDNVTTFALLIEFIGGILAMFSLPDNMLNLMLEGELIFQIGFMMILNRILRLSYEIGNTPAMEIDSQISGDGTN